MNILLKIDKNTNLQVLYALSAFFENLHYKVYIETIPNQYQSIFFEYTLILSKGPKSQDEEIKNTTIVKSTGKYRGKISSNIFFQKNKIPQRDTNVNIVKNWHDIQEPKYLEQSTDSHRILSQKYINYISNKFSTITKL